MKFDILSFGALALAGTLFVSCSSDSKSGDPAAGPEDASAFENASISFNPTINFLANGQVTYINEESGSIFELAPASSPLSGTYTYAPSTNFRTGDMTIDLDGLPAVTVTLSNFVVQDGLVKSFSINFPEEGVFNAIVEGSIQASVTNPTTNSGNVGGGTPSGAETFNFEANGNIASGTTFSKEFLAAGQDQGDTSGSPLPDLTPGETVQFTIASNGNLEFGNISIPFQAATDAGIISYSDGTLSATFDTGATSALSDLSVVWTEIDISNPSAPNIDSLTFAN